MGEAAAKMPTAEPQEWFTTDEAAAYIRLSANALLKHVAAGNIVPDVWGKRGRTRSHRFRRATLDAFMSGGQ